MLEITITDAPRRQSKNPYTEADAKAVYAALQKLTEGKVAAFDTARESDNKARGASRAMVRAIESANLLTATDRKIRTVVIPMDIGGKTQYRPAIAFVPREEA